jgi:hypothetical protein
MGKGTSPAQAERPAFRGRDVQKAPSTIGTEQRVNWDSFSDFDPMAEMAEASLLKIRF